MSRLGCQFCLVHTHGQLGPMLTKYGTVDVMVGLLCTGI